MPNIEFNQIIPDTFNPVLQKTTWLRNVGNMPTVNDGIWSSGIGISTPDEMINKGLTHISKYDLQHYPESVRNQYYNSGKVDEGIPPITPQQLFLPDRGSGVWVPPDKNYPFTWNTRFFDYVEGQTEPLTYQQGVDKGNLYPTNATIIFFENTEQDHAVSSHWNFWRGYYSSLKARMDARWTANGIKYYLAHNYFTYIKTLRYASNHPNFPNQDAATLGESTREGHKALLNMPLNQWPSHEMLGNGTLSSTNTGCFPIYLGAPDLNNTVPYRMAFSGFIHHKANKYLAAYVAVNHEWFPNNLSEVVYPEGKFYLYNKLPLEDGLIISLALISRIFCDGWVGWFNNAGEQDPSQPRFHREYHIGEWFPNGSSSPANLDTFPYWTTGDQEEIFPEQGAGNITGFAMKAYHDTFGQTKGGVRKFLKYRENGGAWITPSNNNADEIVDAYFDKRTFGFSEVKGNIMSVFFINSFATNNESKVLEFEHPTDSSIIYKTNFAGTTAHIAKIIL